MQLTRNKDKLDEDTITAHAIAGALSIRQAVYLVPRKDEDESESEDNEGEDDSSDNNEDTDNDEDEDSEDEDSSASDNTSPDLAVLLENSAPDELFVALKDTWNHDQLNTLAKLLDEYLA